MKILQVKPAVRALITISRALDPLAPRGGDQKLTELLLNLLIANDPTENKGWGFGLPKKMNGNNLILLYELT